MQPKSENMTEVTPHPAQKEWRPPELQRLPIAATAQSSKPGGNSNDGSSPGKGEVSTTIS
jgi:hypothetical protein